MLNLKVSRNNSSVVERLFEAQRVGGAIPSCSTNSPLFLSGDQGERDGLLNRFQAGSIPAAGAIYVERSSMAERQLVELNMRVRFPSLTPISESRLAAMPLALGARFRGCKSHLSDHFHSGLV